MIYLVRKESETPNIQNVEDIIGLKYAGNNSNGVVRNYLNQMSYEVNGREFKVRSGEAIIDGWQVKVDSEGATVTVNNTNSTEYCCVYIEIDLTVADNKQAFLKLVYDSATYPQINKGDDISVIHTGIAKMELYRFVHSSGTINNVQSRFDILDGESYIAKYASADRTKGTIEERLTKLGFKQGSFSFVSTSKVNPTEAGTVQFVENINTIVRQGNYCIGNYEVSFNFQRNPNYSGNMSYTTGFTISIPKEFRPLKETKLPLVFIDSDSLTTRKADYLTIFPSGECTFTISSVNTSSPSLKMVNAGWEAAPL